MKIKIMNAATSSEAVTTTRKIALAGRPGYTHQISHRAVVKYCVHRYFKKYLNNIINGLFRIWI
jgi:hypothetical protein